MKSKISVILLATLSFSLFSFYSVHKVKNSMNWIQNFRKLEPGDEYSEAPSGETTAEQIKELCQNGDEKLFNYYYHEGEYELEYETDEAEDSQTLINLIKDQNTDDVKEYIKKCAKWLAFIIFGILAIIGWVVCCVCACCGCCCFTKCCQNKIASFVTFVLCAACYGVVAILGIYTAASANRAIKGLNNTSCSLLNFVDDIINGQKRHTIPYWKGINGLKLVLESIKNGIDNSINSNKNKFYYSTGNYSNYVTQSDEKINKMRESDIKDSNGFYHFSLTAQGTYGAKTLSPQCVVNYNNFKTLFRDEYDALVGETQDVLEEMEKNFNTVTGCERDKLTCEESTTFKSITDSINAIEDITDSFKNIQTDITDPWYDIQSTINDIGKSTLKIAGSVIAVFCASVCALIILFKLMNCAGKIIKIVIHILWNIVALTTIVSFIAGGVIGLLGKIGIDLVSVMNFILSEENLNAEEPEVIGKMGNQNYLITCLHKNGDLAEDLELKENAGVINELNYIQSNLTYIKGLYGNTEESVSPTLYDNLLENYFTNEFYNYESSQIGNIYELNKEIEDVNAKITQCSVKEYWGIDKKDLKGYDLVDKDHYGNIPINNAFIYVNELQYTNYNSRYGTDTCGTDTQQVATNVGNRLEEVNAFFSSTEMQSLREKEKEIKKNMDGIYKSLNSAIDTSLEIISDITDKLNENVGEDGELWGMINCKFMGEGLKVLLKNIHDGLGSRFVNLGSVLASMAFLEAFAIVFTLITLNANSNPSSK